MPLGKVAALLATFASRMAGASLRFMPQKEQLLRMGFVLAGGQSSRMGVDKAFLKLGESTLLERALATLRSACSGVLIVGEKQKFSAHGRVVEDVFKGTGPLAGIHTALQHSSAELNLVLAVDLPFVTPDLLKFLFTCAEGTAALVTVPRIANGFQPLCAVYRREFAALAEQSLREGKYKIDALFDKVPVRIVEEDELTAEGFSDRTFANLNTPEDLQAASGNL